MIFSEDLICCANERLMRGLFLAQSNKFLSRISLVGLKLEDPLRGLRMKMSIAVAS